METAPTDHASDSGLPPPAGPAVAPAGPRELLRGAPVTRTIVALNVAVFVAQLIIARRADAIAHVPTAESLQFGANYGLATINEHRFETLVTACFLHSGIMHIGLNMLVLWQAGPIVERAVGAARMAPMYLFAGVVSSLLSAIVSWSHGSASYSVGASGAIMGVLAAALVLGWRIQGWRGPVTQAMVRWLGFNLVFGLLINLRGANIDNAAHIGGAIAGGLIAALWRRGVVYSATSTRLVLAGCALVIVASGAAVALRDVLDPYASMMADQRVLVATRARLNGQCAEAHRALAVTQRLSPQNEQLAKERYAFQLDCGRPM